MKWSSVLLLLAWSQVTAQEREAPRPYSVESIRRWQRTLSDWPWPYQPEQEVRLHVNGGAQLLLAVSGGSRSGTFVLFARIKEAWTQVSEHIEQGHHPVHVLESSNQGWYDFETFSPLWGSGGEEVLVSTYRWNGTKYTSQRQQSGKWCQYEPFSSDPNVCPDR